MPDSYDAINSWAGTATAAPPAAAPDINAWANPPREEIDARLAYEDRQRKVAPIFADEGINYDNPGGGADAFDKRLREEVPELPDAERQAYVAQFRQQAPDMVRARDLQRAVERERKEWWEGDNRSWFKQTFGTTVSGATQQYWATRSGPLSVITEAALMGDLERARRNYQAGTEDALDRQTVARYIIRQQEEARKGFGRQTADMLAGMPGFLVDMAVAGGLGRAAVKGVVAKELASGAAQALAMTPGKLAARMTPDVAPTPEGLPQFGPQKQPLSEAGKALAESAIEVGAMHGTGQLLGKAGLATAGPLSQAGFYGPLGFVTQARVAELVEGRTGLRPDYGTLGDLFSGDAGRTEKALRQMGAEAVAGTLVSAGEKLPDAARRIAAEVKPTFEHEGWTPRPEALVGKNYPVAPRPEAGLPVPVRGVEQGGQPAPRAQAQAPPPEVEGQWTPAAPRLGYGGYTQTPPGGWTDPAVLRAMEARRQAGAVPTTPQEAAYDRARRQGLSPNGAAKAAAAAAPPAPGQAPPVNPVEASRQALLRQGVFESPEDLAGFEKEVKKQLWRRDFAGGVDKLLDTYNFEADPDRPGLTPDDMREALRQHAYTLTGRTPPSGGTLRQALDALDNAATGEERQAGARALLERAFDEAGLTNREQHVIRQGLLGRTLEDIGADPEMAKAGGGTRTRESARQVSQKGLDKLARKYGGQDRADVSVRKVIDGIRQDWALNDAEEGRPAAAAAAAGLHGDPEAVVKVARRHQRLDEIDKQMEALADEYTREKEKNGGTLSDEREAEYRAGFDRLDQERKGGHRAAEAAAGRGAGEGAAPGGAGRRGGAVPGAAQHPRRGAAGAAQGGAAGPEAPAERPAGAAAADFQGAGATAGLTAGERAPLFAEGPEITDPVTWLHKKAPPAVRAGVAQEADQRHAFELKQWEQERRLHKELRDELAKLNPGLRWPSDYSKLAHLDRGSVKGLDLLGERYARQSYEGAHYQNYGEAPFGRDPIEAADRIFQFLTQPLREKPSRDAIYRELAGRAMGEHAEAEAGRADEPAGVGAGNVSQVEEGVYFHRGAGGSVPAAGQPGAAALAQSVVVPPERAGQVGRGVLRHTNAERVQRADRDAKALDKGEKYFQVHTEAAPAEKDLPLPQQTRTKRFLAFFTPIEEGRPNDVPADQREFAQTYRRLHDEYTQALVDRGILRDQGLIEDHVGHLWADPKNPDATAADIFRTLMAKRPLAGREGFKKERVLPTYEDGINAGLVPRSWNPMTLAKMEFDSYGKSIFGHDAFDRTRAEGLARYVPLGGKAPPGWRTIPDRLWRVLAPPTVNVREYFDKKQMEALEQFAQVRLGVNLKRVTSGLGRAAGMAAPGEITTKVGTPEEVLAHEIGHQVDRQFPQLRRALNTPALRQELTDLADLRASGQVSASHQAYLRSAPERIANLVAAYVHAPELLKQVAPGARAVLETLLTSEPRLRDLRDIKPSLELGEREQAMRLAGPMLTGHYYMPGEVAQLFERHMSPGLASAAGAKGTAYRAFRGLGNQMSQFLLGWSGYHATATVLNAQFSAMAEAMGMLSRGDFAEALRKGPEAVVPGLAAVQAVRRGLKVRAEWDLPGSQSPEVQQHVEWLKEMGGRARGGHDYMGSQLEQFQKALRQIGAGRYGKVPEALLRALPALNQLASKPIMDYLVPLIKVGVATDAMRYEMMKNPGADLNTRREIGRKIFDQMDDRFGLLTYDNLFLNRQVKDILQTAFLSFGWNLGDVRGLGGGAADAFRPSQWAGLAKGEGISRRTGFLVATMVGTGLYGALYQL
ncbi:MAG TPA: hypothetical protein VFB06_37655, partial [Streptosporangiaceae bacterium]|nr:hypothetical protein [Streptosporangiaceae bacterium]